MKAINEYIYKDNKKLRYGYTTGTCAATAAKAATIMLIKKEKVEKITITTPKGIVLTLDILDIHMNDDYVSCAVKKDSGDDPDITNGILVYAKVCRNMENAIKIDGGIGVGRVTKPGLECKVGEAAINKVPKEMIAEEVRMSCEDLNYHGGIEVEIYIPKGEEIAKRTYNPRLGIEGGISILGTTGIVEPMSDKALVDSIKVQMKMLYANNIRYLIVTPGNYGETFGKSSLNINLNNSIKCSNFIGEVIDYAAEIGFLGLLFIGHIGKFVKLAGGVMNTHSKYADCRMEIITAHAALQGAKEELLKSIMACITTDEAITLLKEAGFMEKTMNSITEKINFHLKHRVYEKLLIGAIMFSNEYGVLGKTEDVNKLLELTQKQEGGKL